MIIACVLFLQKRGLKHESSVTSESEDEIEKGAQDSKVSDCGWVYRIGQGYGEGLRKPGTKNEKVKDSN